MLILGTRFNTSLKIGLSKHHCFISLVDFCERHRLNFNSSSALNIIVTTTQNITLTHLLPMHPFSTLSKHQKTLRFSDVFKE